MVVELALPLELLVLLLEVVLAKVRLLTAATGVGSVVVFRGLEEAGLLSFALAVVVYVSAVFEETVEKPDGIL